VTKADAPARDLQFINPKEWKAGEEIPLPDYVRKAIRCADLSKVKFRNWRPLENEKLTNAEKGMRILEQKCFIPGGNMVGKPVRFMWWQEVIMYLAIDIKPKYLYISLARRNGKTFIQACLILLYLVSFMSERNLSLGSFALAREQAAILYKQLADMIMLSPDIDPLVRCVPSSKRVVSLRTGAEYVAGSAEAKSNLGRSIKYLVLDEAGSLTGQNSDYLDMLRSSQGSFDDSTFAAISTQAASDSDFFSVAMDAAEREQPHDTVCVLFETPKEYEIDDPAGWVYSNPGIGVFRSYEDMKAQAESAKRIASQEGGFRNLCLNQRTSMTGIWLSPNAYKACGGPVDFDVFRENPTTIALDLSARNDLTAAVIAAKCATTGIVHIHPFVFCPSQGIEERSARDRVPYAQWCKSGKMIPIGGKTMDYEQIASYLRDALMDLDIHPTHVVFDRWGITHFKKAAADVSFAQDAEWVECGQGFKDMGPRLAAFETLILQERVRHGMHELFNMSFSNALSISDPAGSKKLAKNLSTQRIDPAVAAVMAVFQVSEGATTELSIESMIG
jgi:phage terminase large subunit-like protein